MPQGGRKRFERRGLFKKHYFYAAAPVWMFKTRGLLLSKNRLCSYDNFGEKNRIGTGASAFAG